MSREVLSITKYDGYEVRREKFTGQEVGLPDGESMEMETAYNLQGDYIGDPALAEHLARLGVRAELADTDHQTCSIGFTTTEQRWYGWSHRGMCSFGIGDRLFEAEYGDDETPLVQHGEYTIEYLEEARQAAVNFAEYVS